MEGKIVELEYLELVLFSLYRMRELLMPNWSAFAKARNIMAAVVVKHIKALAAGEKDMQYTLKIGRAGKKLWEMEVLQQLVSSKYWQNMDSRETTLRLVSKEEDCKKSSVDERASRTMKSAGRQSVKVEEIELADSEDSSSEEAEAIGYQQERRGPSVSRRERCSATSDQCC